jgi:hypothetical protein
MPAYDDRLFAPPAPVARHPDREQNVGDVPMLIDSGADATLLPRSAAASLGLEGTGDMSTPPTAPGWLSSPTLPRRNRQG